MKQERPPVPRVKPLARLVDSERFQIFISGVIIFNAIVLGMSTYSGIYAEWGRQLTIANDVFYGIFLAELLLRIASYGRRPWNFFRNGWNVFDFIVIGGVLLPFLRDQLTILRLLRLARIVRLMRFLPDAQVLILTVTRAIPAVGSMVVLTVLVLFLYAIVGWSMFGTELPEQWGDVGTAMLTLFVLLTLENFPQYLSAAQQVTPWATIFFLSYVLLAAFFIVNLLIGIVISAMDQARQVHSMQALTSDENHIQILLQQVRETHNLLDEIQGELEILARNSHLVPEKSGRSGQQPQVD